MSKLNRFLVIVDIEATPSVLEKYECLMEAMNAISLELETEDTRQSRPLLFSVYRRGCGTDSIALEVDHEVQDIYTRCQIEGPFHITVTN